MTVEKPAAYHEGFAAQKTTYIDQCPYPDGSPEYEAWHDGYADADIADYLKAEKKHNLRRALNGHR